MNADELVIYWFLAWVGLVFICGLILLSIWNTASWGARLAVVIVPFLVGGGALVLAALFKGQFGDILTGIGTLVVALIALFHDAIVNTLNPARAKLHEPVKDEDTQHPGQLKIAQARSDMGLRLQAGCDQYHILVENLNPSRPLINPRVTFQRYSAKFLPDISHGVQLSNRADVTNKRLAVPRQFTWAPHDDLTQRNTPIHRSRVLDLCYIHRYDQRVSLIFYSGAGKYEMGEVDFNEMKVETLILDLVLEADNLPPQTYRLKISPTGSFPTLRFI